MHCFRPTTADDTETVRIQILPEICGSLKEKAKKVIYEYCKTIENSIEKRIDTAASLHNDYWPRELVSLKRNSVMDDDRLEHLKEVGDKFNETMLITQMSETKSTMKRWLIEVSFCKRFNEWKIKIKFF